MRIKFFARLPVHVSCRNCHSPYPAIVRRKRTINRVLRKNYGIVVSECDAAAARPRSCLRNLLRRCPIARSINVTCFGDVPILAKSATEVAASRPERQHACAGIKVIERLLLNWIDTKTRRPAVACKHHAATSCLANKTKAALPIVELALARAKVTLDPPILEGMPPLRPHNAGFDRLAPESAHAPIIA